MTIKTSRTDENGKRMIDYGKCNTCGLCVEICPDESLIISDEKLIAGCVGGALLKSDYLKTIEEAGFKYKIIHEDKEISETQYNGINLESLKVEIYK